MLDLRSCCWTSSGPTIPKAYIAGFPTHPHQAVFETVTYMLAGRMRHRDNAGNEGLLGPGSVQWMTAGRGILHSEMPEQAEGLMQGFQLWVNLPAKDKLTDPRYQDIAAVRVPTAQLSEGASAKVLAGEIAGVRGPVDPGETQPIFVDITLEAGATAHRSSAGRTQRLRLCLQRQNRRRRAGRGVGARPDRRAVER